VEVEIGAELQPAIRVRQGHHPLDVVGHSLAGGVGDVVDRQDDDVVADADAAVLAPVAEEMFSGDCHAHHLLVLMLWAWT
jgi:hypothetical protein